MLLGKYKDVVKNSQVHFVMLDEATSNVLNPKVQFLQTIFVYNINWLVSQSTYDQHPVKLTVHYILSTLRTTRSHLLQRHCRENENIFSCFFQFLIKKF